MCVCGVYGCKPLRAIYSIQHKSQQRHDLFESLEIYASLSVSKHKRIRMLYVYFFRSAFNLFLNPSAILLSNRLIPLLVQLNNNVYHFSMDRFESLLSFFILYLTRARFSSFHRITHRWVITFQLFYLSRLMCWLRRNDGFLCMLSTDTVCSKEHINKVWWNWKISQIEYPVRWFTKIFEHWAKTLFSVAHQINETYKSS